LRGQRGDREIEPFQARGREAEDQADRRRHHARQRNREEHRDGKPVREIGGRERAETEESSVADRDLAGEADDNVEAQRGYGKNADLNKQAEAVFVQDVRRKADQDNADNHRVAAGGGREHRGVCRIGGAEVAGGNEGLACHDDYTRSMSLVPNRPYGLIIRMMISA